ncbi:class D sortase [Candidatus Litorirhabdus singularis]|uniref:class D sortase n=1 Tax=Candidatus Litorirhabdus singularis TaxID=2518993 RepID=UPI002432F71C|nr:class D sortase [Candidatus Litorirhabdus singularis]
MRFLEISFWLLGLGCGGFFLSQLALAEIDRTSDIAAFERALAYQEPDQSQWSSTRIEAYSEGLRQAPSDVVAVLSIPGVQLKVPVYHEDTDLMMDLGAGLIAGTAGPDEAGNIGIAGHRDGYFRALKDIKTGDLLMLQTPAGERRFRVSNISIVDPLDVEVLEPSESAAVTLVTCYPFYYVGSAPQRFIVRAELDTISAIHH